MLPSDFGPKIKKYQDYNVCSYGYKLICDDVQYSTPYKTYFGKAAIDRILNMIKESEYCSKIIEAEFHKSLAVWKDHEGFNISIKCSICKKAYEEGEVKVEIMIMLLENI